MRCGNAFINDRFEIVSATLPLGHVEPDGFARGSLVASEKDIDFDRLGLTTFANIFSENEVGISCLNPCLALIHPKLVLLHLLAEEVGELIFHLEVSERDSLRVLIRSDSHGGGGQLSEHHGVCFFNFIADLADYYLL